MTDDQTYDGKPSTAVREGVILGQHLGQVLVNDEPEKKRFYRFCEKHVARWAAENGAELDVSDFRVSISDDPDGRSVSCETEIQLGGRMWRGYDLAANLQMAFMHSMKRLQPH